MLQVSFNQENQKLWELSQSSKVCGAATEFVFFQGIRVHCHTSYGSSRFWPLLGEIAGWLSIINHRCLQSITEVRWENWASNDKLCCVLGADNHPLTVVVSKSPPIIWSHILMVYVFVLFESNRHIVSSSWSGIYDKNYLITRSSFWETSLVKGNTKVSYSIRFSFSLHFRLKCVIFSVLRQQLRESMSM